MIISLLPHSNQLGLIYYIIMAKLALTIKPTFIKVLLIKIDGPSYTVGPFIYNPKVRFNFTLVGFIEWITHQINIIKEEYDIDTPYKVNFILVYPISAIKAV